MRNVQKISAVVALIIAPAAGLAALETWAEPRPPIVMAGNKVGPDVCECPVLIGTCVCRIVNL